MTTESAVQQLIRRDFPLMTHGQIWRNNSGACTDQTGRLVRYGLGNDSAKLNAEIKSSDLIGITPVLITPDMVGYWLGVFTAIEVKQPGWTMPARKRNRLEDESEAVRRAYAQARYHDIVRQSCGFAGFATDVADIAGIIRRG